MSNLHAYIMANGLMGILSRNNDIKSEFIFMIKQ